MPIPRDNQAQSRGESAAAVRFEVGEPFGMASESDRRGRDGSWIQGPLRLGEDLPIQNVQSSVSRFHVAYATWNRDTAEATETFSAAARLHVAQAIDAPNQTLAPAAVFAGTATGVTKRGARGERGRLIPVDPNSPEGGAGPSNGSPCGTKLAHFQSHPPRRRTSETHFGVAAKRSSTA